ncbi:MAG: hypothetical protein IJ934_03345 [Acetobacter sp.]|nr:hypothetical protein [Acetobacter sp.]
MIKESETSHYLPGDGGCVKDVKDIIESKCLQKLKDVQKQIEQGQLLSAVLQTIELLVFFSEQIRKSGVKAIIAESPSVLSLLHSVVSHLPFRFKKLFLELLPQEIQKCFSPMLCQPTQEGSVSKNPCLVFALSLSVGDIKKIGEKTNLKAYVRQALSYWVGEEKEWGELLKKLEKENVKELSFSELTKQDDSVDAIIISCVNMRQNDENGTFLAFVNTVEKLDKISQDIKFYTYPRKLNILSKEFGFRKG